MADRAQPHANQPTEANIFHSAVDIVQGLPKAGPIQSSYDEKLAMYSLYKQATEGPPNMPRPGMFDMLGRAKWDAWEKQKRLSSVEAMMAYVDVLLQVLHKYSDNADARAYIQHLEQLRGRDPHARRRARKRSGSTSSRSSASSTSSFHEASDAEYTYGDVPAGATGPTAPIAGPSTHLAPPPSHIPPPLVETVAQLQPAPGPSSGPVPYPQDSPRLWQNPRRGSNASSIALGGDAASLHASRPPSRVGTLLRGGTGTAPLSAQTLTPGQAYAQQVYRSHSYSQTDGERQLRQAIDERLPDVPERVPSGGAPDADRPLPRIPLHSPLGTPRFDYRERLSPVATFYATPYAPQRLAQDRHRPRPSIDGFVRSFTPGPTGMGGIDLPLALQQIQTSLTALHERISSLEEAQTRILTQPGDPFTAVLRLFLPARDVRRRQGHRHGQRRALPLRLLWRLLSTAGRAALDVLFLLVVASLSIGVWAGVRGRGRGGRTAIVAFWRMAYNAGRMLLGGLPSVQQIARR